MQKSCRGQQRGSGVKKAIMGGKFNIVIIMLLEVFGGRVLWEFRGNLGEKAIKRH